MYIIYKQQRSHIQHKSRKNNSVHFKIMLKYLFDYIIREK